MRIDLLFPIANDTQRAYKERGLDIDQLDVLLTGGLDRLSDRPG